MVENNKDDSFSSPALQSTVSVCDKKPIEKKKIKLLRRFCILAPITLNLQSCKALTLCQKKENQIIEYGCYWSNDGSAYKYKEPINIYIW